VPIRGDGIHVRTEEGVFRLAKIRSLSEVLDKVGGDLLRPHESVLVNEEWIHDYSSVRAEIGVLVDGTDGKSYTERIQVSTRNKEVVEGSLFKGRPKRPRPPSKPVTPASPGSC
jgi:DNA-binding LytR/AlgR family response regulator